MQNFSMDRLEELSKGLPKREPKKDVKRVKEELMQIKMKHYYLKPLTIKKMEGEVRKRHKNPFRS